MNLIRLTHFVTTIRRLLLNYFPTGRVSSITARFSGGTPYLNEARELCPSAATELLGRWGLQHLIIISAYTSVAGKKGLYGFGHNPFNFNIADL